MELIKRFGNIGWVGFFAAVSVLMTPYAVILRLAIEDRPSRLLGIAVCTIAASGVVLGARTVCGIITDNREASLAAKRV